MKNLKTFLRYGLLIFGFGCLFTNPSFARELSNATDLLEQAFTPAIQTDTVVGGDAIGTTKESVGRAILQDGTDINVSFSDGISTKTRPSLLVQIAKFLLRISIILAITMIIYNGIMYMIKASKGENPKDILQNLVYIGAGLLLALLSIVIVRLASSAGSSFNILF